MDWWCKKISQMAIMNLWVVGRFSASGSGKSCSYADNNNIMHMHGKWWHYGTMSTFSVWFRCHFLVLPLLAKVIIPFSVTKERIQLVINRAREVISCVLWWPEIIAKIFNYMSKQKGFCSHFLIIYDDSDVAMGITQTGCQGNVNPRSLRDHLFVQSM